VPRDLELHHIVDNYCTNKHAELKAWLAQRPRFHVHDTATYTS
jgi:putative transposase